MTKRKSKAIAPVNMETEIVLPTADASAVVNAGDTAVLDDLLGDLETVESDVTISAASTEIIEGAVSADAGVSADDALLEDIVGGVETQEKMQQLYAEQPGQEADGTEPETTPDAVTGKGKGKRKAKAKADGEGEKEPKPARATSVTHKPGDLLKAKLGDKAPDFLIFSTSDAVNLTAEQLAEKADAFIARMNDKDAIADKVREKIIMFFTWMHKGGELNEVMKRALTVLHTEGKLTSGDKGNLQLNLLSKPYSMGTARSQANQMFMAFPEMGLCVKTKGTMEPNSDSALLAMAYAKLGLV